jgi:hypothetical protein
MALFALGMSQSTRLRIRRRKSELYLTPLVQPLELVSSFGLTPLPPMLTIIRSPVFLSQLYVDPSQH